MLQLFILSFLITFFYTPYGYFIEKGSTLRSYSLQLIYGLIFLSFFAVLINFFYPLGIYINSVFLLISLLILIKFKKRYFSKKYIFFCFISASIVFLLLACSNVYRPDAGLYHLPYISILNNEKIIIGLSNLHFRFGHTSIIQYISAISNNFLLKDNGINFPSALIASSVIINFVSNLNIRLKKKNFDLYFFVTLSLLIFIFYKINRFSEYGNDAPGHLLFFILVCEILKNIDNLNSQKISNYFLLSIFIIMNKIILLVSFLFPLSLLIFYKKFSFLSLRNIFITIFLFIWVLKNIFISGCILYPAKNTCIKSLYWTNYSEANLVSIENEAWAKGWPDFRKNSDKFKKIEYSKNFNWLKTWLKNHFLKIVKIITPFILFLLLLLLLIFEKNNKRNKKNKYLIIFQIISFIGLILWLLKVPVFRYGYSYLILLISLIFGMISIKFNIIKKRQLFLQISILILMFVFVTKNLNRIIASDKYYNYPWPKIYSMNENNISKKTKYKVINKKKIYYAEDGYCMYDTSPCGPLDGKLMINKTKGYLFFYK